MKNLIRHSMFVFILFYLIIESSCGYSDSQINNEHIKTFAISNILNIKNHNTEPLGAKRNYDTYYTEFTLTNLCRDTFTVVRRSRILPQHSLGWDGSQLERYLNYEIFSNPQKNKTITLFPMDSMVLFTRSFELSILDSFLYRPEIVLNNKRYRLEYMFRKKDDGSGYYLKDSTSTAVMMKDSTADYSNFRLGVE